MQTTKKIPASLQNRIDNVKNRYGVTISNADSIEAYRSDEGASSVGYWFDAPSHRASLTIGDLAIDLGQWLLGRTDSQPRRFQD
jgi:hypothetical protein